MTAMNKMADGVHTGVLRQRFLQQLQIPLPNSTSKFSMALLASSIQLSFLSKTVHIAKPSLNLQNKSYTQELTIEKDRIYKQKFQQAKWKCFHVILESWPWSTDETMGQTSHYPQQTLTIVVWH